MNKIKNFFDNNGTSIIITIIVLFILWRALYPISIVSYFVAGFVVLISTAWAVVNESSLAKDETEKREKKRRRIRIAATAMFCIILAGALIYIICLRFRSATFNLAASVISLILITPAVFMLALGITESDKTK